MGKTNIRQDIVDVIESAFPDGIIEEKALQALHSLRIKITSILESFSIALLPVEEAHKTVSWLKAGEGAFVGKEITGEVITVRQVLFFRGV